MMPISSRTHASNLDRSSSRPSPSCSRARSVGAEELLPRPAGLEPNVRFWTRIYTEIDDAGGLDPRLPTPRRGLRGRSDSRRASPRRARGAARREDQAELRGILKQLARGKRTGLSDEEARVLAVWPAGVSNATLRTAARDVRFQLGQADRFRAGLVRAGAWRDYIEQTLERHRRSPRTRRPAPRRIVLQPERLLARRRRRPVAVHALDGPPLPARRQRRRRAARRPQGVGRRSEAAAEQLRDARNLAARDHRLQPRRGGDGARGAQAGHRRHRDDRRKHYDGRTFGFASRNFYAEFLAALDVDRNAERYFGPIHSERPRQFETVVLDHFYTPATLERAFGVDRETLREYNQSLRPAVWNGAKYVPRGYELALPPKRSRSRPRRCSLRFPRASGRPSSTATASTRCAGATPCRRSPSATAFASASSSPSTTCAAGIAFAPARCSYCPTTLREAGRPSPAAPRRPTASITSAAATPSRSSRSASA